jgi:hypothetical protein
MKLLKKEELLSTLTGSKNSGFFEFNPTGSEESSDMYAGIFSIVANSFLVDDYRCLENYGEHNVVLSKEYWITAKFFFYGVRENKNSVLDIVSIKDIILLRVYRDAVFELELKENLFTDEIYFFQDGKNNDRAIFKEAAILNRQLLKIALSKIEKETKSEIVDFHCELPIKIYKYGFFEGAALEYDRI